MAVKLQISKLMILFVTLFSLFHSSKSVYSIDFQNPSDCKRGNDRTHQFFDFSQMRCTNCAQDSSYQTVSADGLRCICQSGMKLEKNFGGVAIFCSPCSDNQVTSNSGWSCVACGADNPLNAATDECAACGGDNPIVVEREMNGAWGSTVPTRQCQTCQAQTMPVEGGTRCERCNQVLSVRPSQTDCICPEAQSSGGLCFESPTDLVAIASELYRIKYDDSLTVDSAYFNDHIRAAEAMCQQKYANLTACQLLGNMCNLIMYSRENEARGGINDACMLYLNLASGGSRAQQEWPQNMPWLYYEDDSADTILADNRITTEYTFPSSQLNLTVAKYALNGTFLGITRVNGGLLQLCKASDTIMDAAYDFGTTYSQKCDIEVKDLFDQSLHELVFYDLYLEFGVSGQEKLFAVPVLVENYRDSSGAVNGGEREGWKFTRRFFLVDNISGIPIASPSTNAGTGTDTQMTQNVKATQPRAVRYASSMTLHVELQKDTKEGKIFPPYLQINYAVAKEEDLDAKASVRVTFDVKYNMDLTKYNNDFDIAIGVLSALSLGYAILLTWGWNKRMGQTTITFLSLVKFVVFAINNLANVFFVVTLGTATWWLIFYKRQNTVYLIIPNAKKKKVPTATLR